MEVKCTNNHCWREETAESGLPDPTAVIPSQDQIADVLAEHCSRRCCGVFRHRRSQELISVCERFEDLPRNVGKPAQRSGSDAHTYSLCPSSAAT